MKLPWQKKPQKKQKVATKTDFKSVLLKPFKDSDSVAKIFMVLTFILLAAFIFPSERAIIFSDFVVGSPAPKEVIFTCNFYNSEVRTGGQKRPRKFSKRYFADF